MEMTRTKNKFFKDISRNTSSSWATFVGSMWRGSDAVRVGLLVPVPSVNTSQNPNSKLIKRKVSESKDGTETHKNVETEEFLSMGLRLFQEPGKRSPVLIIWVFGPVCVSHIYKQILLHCWCSASRTLTWLACLSVRSSGSRCRKGSGQFAAEWPDL